MADTRAVPVDGTPDVGARLRQARLRRGLSLRGLARLLDVSPATLSAVENGHRAISPVRAAQAAAALGLAVEELAPAADGASAGPAAADDDRAQLLTRTTAAGPDDWRRFPPLELDPPLAAALDTFLEFGYHGATVREIARRAGLSVPGVYHYYASKQDMLVALLDTTMADLAGRTAAARDEGRDAVERFALLVECLALYHTHRRELGFVGASEMRSLTPPERARVARVRREQQRMVDEQVEQACREGRFSVSHPREASRAVVTMCTALPQWFDGQGPTPAEEVAAQYVEFALSLMGCTDGRTQRRVPARASRGAG